MGRSFNDKEGPHRRMSLLLQYFKRARAGKRGGWFPEAFEVLDKGFGGKDWQVNRRGGESGGMHLSSLFWPGGEEQRASCSDCY